MGLGTTLPSTALHINSTNNFTIATTNQTNAANSYISFVDTGTTAGHVRCGSQGNDFVVNAGGIRGMRIKSNGRVGIGNENPGEKLTIGGEDNPTLRIHTAENGDNWSTSFQYGKLQFYSDDYEYNSGGEMASISVGVNNNFGQTSSLRFNTTTARSAGAVPTERMRLQGSTLMLGGTLPSSPNISLSAGNGTASFSNTLNAKGLWSRNNLTTDEAFKVTTNTGNTNVLFLGDGSASFMGRIGLNRDASTEAWNAVTIPSGNTSDIGYFIKPSSNSDTNSYKAFVASSGGLEKVQIYNTGSAKFTGSVSIGGTDAAHTMDEYEEGTWIPAFIGTSSAGTPTYGTNGQAGKYIKVGNKVTAWAFIHVTALGGAAGNINITGLPYAIDNTGFGASGISVGHADGTLGNSVRAGNGTASFSNTLNAKGLWSRNNLTTDEAFKVTTNTGNTNVLFLGDGSASFMGRIGLNRDASTEAWNAVTIPSGNTSDIGYFIKPSSNSDTNSYKAFVASSGGLEKVQIYNTGSAKFTGSVSIGGTDAAHTMDEYEEGTWIPAFIGTSSAGTPTYGTNGQAGKYIKVGNKVTAWAFIHVTALGGAAGNINITGLPYAIDNTGFGASGISVGHADGTLGNSVRAYHNTTFLELRNNNSVVTAATGQIYVSISYTN